ncbi:flagellar type III secretion system pore protein FliP [Enterococcus sp. LJL98]
MKSRKNRTFWWMAFLLAGLVFFFKPIPVEAVTTDEWTNTISQLVTNGDGSNTVVNNFILITLLSLIPVLLIMTTSFTRTVMVLSFVRNSLGTQQNPPNQVLIGLALFLTFFVMRPVYTDIYEQAIQPYQAQEISQEEVFERSENRMKEFMYGQTRKQDLELFLEIAEEKGKYPSYQEVPLTILTPAFIISELRTAFSIGFLLFIPFLIIDMVVASILMSMGMFMLSPVMISLPFKLLLFVLVDGWYLVVESLVRSFQ